MGFNFLSQAPGGTAKYAFDGLSTSANPPVFTVKPASEANAAYQSLRFKTQNDPRVKATAKRLSAFQLNETREYWAEIFAKTVVVSWANVFEEDGTAAACTPDKVLEFLMSLLVRLDDGSQPLVEEFERFRSFCWNSDNFRDTPPAEVAALGKG